MARAGVEKRLTIWLNGAPVGVWEAAREHAKQLAPQWAKLAMAISGKNAHYRIHDIQRRHWSEQAARIGLGALAAEEIVAEVLQQAPAVVESVYGQLPADFPLDMADSILNGILSQSERLAHVPAA